LRDSLRKALNEGLTTEESTTAFEEIEMPLLPPLFHKNEYQEKLNKKASQYLMFESFLLCTFQYNNSFQSAIGFG